MIAMIVCSSTCKPVPSGLVLFVLGEARPPPRSNAELDGIHDHYGYDTILLYIEYYLFNIICHQVLLCFTYHTAAISYEYAPNGWRLLLV